MVATDIVFVIRTKPHARFERRGQNLICTVMITLEQALTGIHLLIVIHTLAGWTHLDVGEERVLHESWE